MEYLRARGIAARVRRHLEETTMTKNVILKSKLLPAALIGLAMGLTLAACGNKTETQPATDTAAADAAAREQQLAAR